jgi:hypothetical protein
VAGAALIGPGKGMTIMGRIIEDRPDAVGGDRAPADRDATRHRVRVGVTGLAVVFLLTVFAAALISLFKQDDRGTTRLANGQIVTNGTLPPEAPKEPLAELGVAPGNMPPGNAALPAPPRPAVAPAAPPRR